MKLLWSLLLTAIFFLSLTETVTSIKCTNTKTCSCIPSTPRHGFSQNYKNYYFNCPPNVFTVGGAILHLRENGTRIQIDCHRISVHFNSKLFAKIDAGNVTWIDITKDCPLPRNESFGKIIKKLTPTKPLALAFERMLLTEESLSKDHFKGLDKLQKLSLRFNRLRSLDEDIFANTPALTVINLQGNKIHFKPDLFKFTPKLNGLDISENEIERLPEGLFGNLTSLESLSLWNNRLQSLDNATFKGLSNLTVLELALNQIETVAVGTFADLTKLTNLSLSYNLIADVSADLLIKNKLLEEILLHYNPRLTLSDYALANLPKLRNVGMTNSNLSSVPANLFSGSTALRVLTLDHNRLQSLPDGFFEGLGELIKVNLGKNLLKQIPDFHGLRKLEHLHLDYNALTRIDKQFEQLTNLAVLNIEHNKITQIGDSAFPASLRILSLAYNRYNFGESTPFGGCVNLELLDLSHNSITTIWVLNQIKVKELFLDNNFISDVDLMQLLTVTGGKIFLRNNNITKINFHSAQISQLQDKLDLRNVTGGKIFLRNNDGTKINFHSAKIFANLSKANRSTEVYLKGNPFECNCNAYDLARYLQDKLDPNFEASVKLVSDEIICASPKYLENNLVEELQLEALSCPLEGSEECPLACRCSYEPHGDRVVYDCSFKNLTQIPDLSTKRRYNRTKVLLQGNKLRRGPARGLKGWDYVTELYLSQNMIQNMTWVPPVLQVLTLDYNNLSSLPNVLLESLNHSRFRHIRLDHNPWKCDCGALNLTNFLREHSRLIDTEDIRCIEPPHNFLTKLHKHNLCEERNLLLWILIPALVIVAFVLSGLVLYYKHEKSIKVWLYANNLCLSWVTEEDLDKDKRFDVFLSFAHQDDDFVDEELMPKLKREYKVCSHYENWVGGSLIGDQAIRSINSSRRTLVVLSSNYLKSKWGLMEFKTAHHKAMSDKRPRLIVILKGEIDMERLDEDLKSYVKTHTYVKWGDPRFWSKLQYALPHRPRSLARADPDHGTFVPIYD